MIVHIPIYLTEANKLYLSSKIDIDPLVLSTKNIYGMYIYNMLSKYPAGSKPVSDICMDRSYSEKVIVQVSELVFYKKGIHISNHSNHTFNLFIKRLMLDEFHAYMDFHFLLNRAKLRQAIWDWMLKSNLHEDALALRTLEKDYERYRKATYENTSKALMRA